MGEKKKPDELPKDVPYLVHEDAMVRNERAIRRLVAALIVAILTVFASNLAWLIAWCQYDYASDTITVDSKDGGNANYLGGNGDINNGESFSEETTADEEER